MGDHHRYCTGGFSPDDVVISGMSGRFPLCKNVEELNEALLTQKNLLIQRNNRYEKGSCNLPFSSSGTLDDLDKFDNEFFGIPTATVSCLDILQKLVLEVTYEAIVDAGYDLHEINDRNIGVYTAISNQDCRDIALMEKDPKPNFAHGYLRTMIANRCSHVFNLHGPTFTVDSACSSSLVALWTAVNDIREGRVDSAIVNAGQLCINPEVTKCYLISGIVSEDCSCFPFDAKANGMVRSEAITALYIQKASEARRAYATILDIQHAGAGFVPEGIYVPNVKEEIKLFNRILKNCDLKPDDIMYVEGHGTGTRVGDPIEVKAIESAYCTKDRSKPLYLGSVKSNLGHSEAASGQSGAIKVLLAFETGQIAPNYNFEFPNPDCEAIVNGKIKVVAEPTTLLSPYVPVNAFGFGGSLLTVMLKQNPIERKNEAKKSEIPRIVLYPATTEHAVQKVFQYIETHPELGDDFFALLNKLSFASIMKKPYRGYAVYDKGCSTQLIKNVQYEKKREVWFVMTGMGCQWPGMGLEMMKIGVFAESMKKTAAVLNPFGIDLFEMLKKDSKELLTNRRITPAFTTIAAIQIALIDTLRALNIEPDGIIGHSTGELVCAYADGCCTAEQTILSAYWRGKSVEDANLPDGVMAAVGLTWEEAVRRCPEGVYPACHNAYDSITISGLKEPVEKFVAELQKDNIFARVVNAYGFAFHCQKIWPASKKLKDSLSEIITNPQPRTARWLSTSYPEKEWLKEDCMTAGPEYFTHNLMSTVRFHEVLEKIPRDAITIEIGPHFLLQSILKRSIGSSASYFGLMKRNEENSVGFFMDTIGKLYIEGLDPKIENIYPPVNFPVPRGTPMISSLIEWDHSLSHAVDLWKPSSGCFSCKYHLDKEHKYLLDHYIDGRSLFPATGYILLAWQALASELQKGFEDINVVVENFKIHRATLLNPVGVAAFDVKILDKSGSFEVSEGKSLVASGKVYRVESVAFTEPSPGFFKDETSTFVSADEIYNELKIHGYEYGPAFRRLVEADVEGTKGFVEWNDWISLLDSLLLFYMFTSDNDDFVLPVGALNFKICPSVLKNSWKECQNHNLPGLPVNFHHDSAICRTPGIEITRLEVDAAPQHITSDDCVLEEYKFVPYFHRYTCQKSEEEIEKYKEACNNLVEKIESQLGVDLSTGKFQTKNGSNFDLKSYIDSFGDQKSILSTLSCISNNGEKMDASERNVLFDIFVQSIGKDNLNTVLLNEYCLRFMFDIILENSFRKLNVLEVNNGFNVVLPKTVEVVEKYSMIKFRSKTLVCNKEDVDVDIISACNIQLLPHDKWMPSVQDKSQGVAISSFLTGTRNDAKVLINLLTSKVEQRGFIMLYHKNALLPTERLLLALLNQSIKVLWDDVLEKIFEEENLVIVSKISDKVGGNLYLLRQKSSAEMGKLIKISENITWFDELKSSTLESKEIWLLSNDPSSGIIGMVNCLLREPGGDKIRCIFRPGNKPDIQHFNLSDPFFKNLLETDLVMNVYQDGSWGSFRHIRINKDPEISRVDHSYVNIKKYGDLSSFQWVESAIKHMDSPETSLVHTYYSALNFRDVMLATGRISKLTAAAISSSDNCVLGLEFSGRTNDGRRVCGVCSSRGIATANKLKPYYFLNVPDEWSLEDAATVPVVYTTCYYAMILRGRLEPGESILIHSGTGGIGLAAINIALSMNCEVFTTVGTEEKRQYLIKNFTRLKPENIGCSRNTTFENMIMKRTRGRGVDMVLNSLAEEKFHASVRCVAKHGRFIEIGKYDLALDNSLGLKFFLKNVSFIGVFLDQLFGDSKYAVDTLRKVLGFTDKAIKDGVVKPLNRTVFQRDETEKAFRFMGAGTHIGKVLIKIRDEEGNRFAAPTLLRLPAIPVTYFYANKVYIVVGGLGGFGIEVTKWILSKGARNLVLTTRYGARTPYHHLCLRRWKSKGYNVVISTRNVSVKEEAAELLKEASAIGPVGGIFNSAVVLHDAFIENMDQNKFKAVCAPKADATKHLDSLSRALCPSLDHFVCFSSISCGRGNAGQMNYGYANSVMERICEQRQKDGFHGLAIQWGIIGEVGVVHRHMGDDAMIAGVGAQRVQSCLDILDKSCQLQLPVVSSYVIKDLSRKKGDQADTLQQLARIFGLKDSSEFNPMRSFSEMGVDSMIGIEIKHLLETSLDTTFTVKEIQELKIDDVKMLLDKVEAKKAESQTALVSTICTSMPKSFIHQQSVLSLNKGKKGLPVFILDLDCSDTTGHQMLGNFANHPTFALLCANDTPFTDVPSMASWFVNKIKETTKESYHIIAHSSASVVALEILHQDPSSIKSFTILNGYSALVKATTKELQTKPTDVDIIYEFVEQYIPSPGSTLRERLTKASGIDQKLRTVVDLFSKSGSETFDKTELTDIVASYVKKVRVLEEYTPEIKISKDILIAEDASKLLSNDIAEVKMLLAEICNGKLHIHRIPGMETFTDESVKMFWDGFCSQNSRCIPSAIEHERIRKA